MSTTPPTPAQIPAPTQDETAQRLNSWKEIASHFGRDVRTVQLWEKKESLPVHRHGHSARSSVYAYPEELARWLKNRRQDPQQETAMQRPESPAAAESQPAQHRFRPSRLRRVGTWSGLAMVVVIAFAASLLSIRKRTPEAAPAQAVLAVLPFESLSRNNSDEFLADGLTDDLITDFGRSGFVQVMSRRSVMQFKDRHESLPEIAGQLHATLILEGTTAYLNGQVRITAQLLDANNDRLIWAQNYTRKTDDVLLLQDDVAAHITDSVSQVLKTSRSVHATDGSS